MPSFAEALYSLPADRLRALIELRSIDPGKLNMVSDKRTLVQHLANELSKQPSVSAAVKCLNVLQIRMLQLAGSAENSRSLDWSTLVERAGGADVEPALAENVERLEEYGLLFRVGAAVYVPEMVRRLTPPSLSDRYTVSTLLNAYDAAAIRRVADKLGLETEYATKSANIAEIRTHLIAAMSTLRFRSPLTEAEIGVLEFLIQRGGSASPLEVAGVLKDGSADDFFRYEWQNRWKQGKEKNAVDSMLARGVLHVITSGYGYNLILVVPGDLLLAFVGANANRFWTDPIPVPTPAASPPTHTAAHSAVLRDAVCMLACFAVLPCSRTNTGHIHKSSLKNISRTLSIQDESYAAFLYAIIREAGLAAPEGERQLYALTRKGSSWLQMDPHEQTSILYEAWRDGTVWAEMYGEQLMRNNEYRNRDVIRTARLPLLERMASVSKSDEFISIDSIVSAVAFSHPLLLADCTASMAGAGTTLARFTRDVIVECLFWLGMVDLGGNSAAIAVHSGASTSEVRASGASVTCFRVTQTYARILQANESQEQDAQPSEDKFLVQANAEIFIPPYLKTDILYRLLTLTDLSPRGVAGATAVLSRESIRRALDLGDTSSDVLGFLQAHSRTGVPQNVEYLINEVGGKHGHIRVGTAHMYVSVDSPLLLKELRARRELKDYFIRDLTDTVAILDAEDLEKVLKELRKAGYLPVSDDARANDALRLSLTAPEGKTAPKRQAAKRIAESSGLANVVDWQRIAADDGKAWHTHAAALPADTAKPAGAYDNQSLIRVMMHNACITHNVVEIVCRPPGQESVRMLFEPVRMTGNVIRGYCQGADGLMDLEIEAIRWAKLTPEKF